MAIKIDFCRNARDLNTVIINNCRLTFHGMEWIGNHNIISVVCVCAAKARQVCYNSGAAVVFAASFTIQHAWTASLHNIRDSVTSQLMTSRKRGEERRNLAYVKVSGRAYRYWHIISNSTYLEWWYEHCRKGHLQNFNTAPART